MPSSDGPSKHKFLLQSAVLPDSVGGSSPDIHLAAPIAANAEAHRERSINRSTDRIAKLRND
jgi:hypothetical protein